MSQDTNVPNLVINKLTKEQYDGIANPDPTQLYMITDEVITDTDVTNALGYTPYDSSNPDGFISDASVSSLSDVTLTSLSDGQALVYDSSSSKWINSTVNSLPSQSGQSGKFLTTNGSTASWANVPTEIPSQTGNTGKFLTTNGSAVSWANVDALPSQSGNNGKILTTNGSSASWSSLKTLNSTSLLGSGDITVLQNTATGNSSITILGNSTSKNSSINIGYNSSISNVYGSVAIGDYATITASQDNGGKYNTAIGCEASITNATNSVAIGFSAIVSSTNSIQLGYGTNSTANTFNVGFSDNHNYQLLDGTTGLIPDARLSSNIQRTLVSGTSIKTVNSTSLLGSGDIAVQPVISSSAMLSSDLVDDTNHTHKFATAAQLTQISTNTGDISTINGKIPSAATTTNQLADKAFVNSSISTNTANFIGTFNSVAELEAYTGTLTNNDYAFVATVDTAGNTLYDRYKYNAGTQEWMFEYEINNSSFTAAQWGSINSGITSSDVTLIGTALQPANVDHTFDGSSYKPQSGVAIAGELANYYVPATRTVNNKALSSDISLSAADVGALPASTVIPTVNNATLTIQKNGTTVKTFTANASTNVTANITVPTKTSDLTNDSGYISGITSSDVTTALSYTPADNTLSNVSSIDSNSAVQTALDSKVSKSGDTMTGHLAITENAIAKIELTNTSFDPTSTTAPASNLYAGAIDIFGLDNYHVGHFRTRHNTGNYFQSQMGVKRNVNNTVLEANITVAIDPNGTFSCTFPDTTCVDGQWVSKSVTVMSGQDLNGSTNLSYTLTDVPNDGYKYEVLLTGQATSGTTAGNAVKLEINSDAITGGTICTAQTRTASTITSSGAVILPLTTSRKIYVLRSTSFHGTGTLYLRGYRRIGTNA